MPSIEYSAPMKPTPRPILALVGLLSLFLLASGGYGVWFAIDLQAWFRIGFEVVLVVSGVIGLLTALNRFPSAPAWAMSCVGGAAVICALLANSAGGMGQVAGFSPGAIVRSAITNPHAAARLGAGFGMLALAALTLMLRSPAVSFRRFGLGVLCLAPVIVIGALWFAGPLSQFFGGLNPIIQTVIAVLAFFSVVALVSAGGHNLIRALEAGVEGQDERNANAA